MFKVLFWKHTTLLDLASFVVFQASVHREPPTAWCMSKSAHGLCHLHHGPQCHLHGAQVFSHAQVRAFCTSCPSSCRNAHLVSAHSNSARLNGAHPSANIFPSLDNVGDDTIKFVTSGCWYPCITCLAFALGPFGCPSDSFHDHTHRRDRSLSGPSGPTLRKFY